MLTAAMQRIEISDRIEMKSLTAEKCSLLPWAQACSSAPLRPFRPSDASSRAAVATRRPPDNAPSLRDSTSPSTRCPLDRLPTDPSRAEPSCAAPSLAGRR